MTAPLPDIIIDGVAFMAAFATHKIMCKLGKEMGLRVSIRARWDY